jgi:hypothetical protein
LRVTIPDQATEADLLFGSLGLGGDAFVPDA